MVEAIEVAGIVVDIMANESPFWLMPNFCRATPTITIIEEAATQGIRTTVKDHIQETSEVQKYCSYKNCTWSWTFILLVYLFQIILLITPVSTSYTEHEF